MKRSAFTIFLLAILSTSLVQDATSAPSLPAGTWIPNAFEIHIFDVNQGDSQLIIFPSGYTLLIDLGELSYTTDKNAVLIASKIRELTGGSHINIGLITHLHMDHLGYVGHGGFWALIEEQGITFDRIIDRDAGVWQDGYDGSEPDGVCNYETEIIWHNAGDVTNTARKWLCYATNPANTLIYSWREIAQPSSTAQIDPPDPDVTVTIIQADAADLMMADGTTPVAGDHTADSIPPSENDYSIALKITYGEIDYVTAGDTDGEYYAGHDDDENYYAYNDGETLIVPRIVGPVELLRVNHHGSSHSSNQFYIDSLNPADAFISCGSNTYGHPDQVVLDRLATTSNVYLTNLCDPTRDYTGSTIVNGDITVRSIDGLTYTVAYLQWVYLPLINKP